MQLVSAIAIAIALSISTESDPGAPGLIIGAVARLIDIGINNIS